MSKTRRKYSEEFKQEAVQLAEKTGVSKASKELGVHQTMIRRWMKCSTKGGITTSNELKMDLEAENRRLRRENEYLKKINDVLKKSTAIFSNDHFGSSK